MPKLRIEDGFIKHQSRTYSLTNHKADLLITLKEAIFILIEYVSLSTAQNLFYLFVQLSIVL